MIDCWAGILDQLDPLTENLLFSKKIKLVNDRTMNHSTLDYPALRLSADRDAITLVSFVDVRCRLGVGMAQTEKQADQRIGLKLVLAIISSKDRQGISH